MLTHILCSLTKEEAKLNIDYVRILGFDKNGKEYLNVIKKEIGIPLITNYKNTTSKLLDIEYRVLKIYSLLTNDSTLIKREISKPVKK